ncbi:MAG: hypothetical protein JRF30_03330 [Deltaproteobacteria bacterium]|nr:hypothetical protein [Deltaproteobacteria bacterium]MBW1794576.1 hypothetical protein [Deltaproteobacteria bacterium]MBW2329969.1 hypothetical protein [Deltaproteobacteria bacterium]
MTSTDVLEEQKEESIDGAVGKSLSDTDEQAKDALEEDAPAISASESGMMEEAIMPEIRGLEILKEGTYAVDVEKTITQMYGVIKNMEAQLQKVLAINAELEKDLDASKDMIAELKLSRSQLENTIARMEEKMPSKRELQIEIDHLIEERNAAQTDIRDMKLRLERMEEIAVRYQDRITGLEEEKRDAVAEINFLESQVNSVAERTGRYENEINVLRGEKLAHIEKIKSLNEELNETLGEKYRLFKEVKETKHAMEEIRSALVKAKLQAKKSFYKTNQ